MTQDCMPPMMNRGIGITISIDLGDLFGPGLCMPGEKPKESDDDKLTFFNENNRPKKHGDGFKGALDNVCGPGKKEPKEDEADEEEDEEC